MPQLARVDPILTWKPEVESIPSKTHRRLREGRKTLQIWKLGDKYNREALEQVTSLRIAHYILE